MQTHQLSLFDIHCFLLVDMQWIRRQASIMELLACWILTDTLLLSPVFRKVKKNSNASPCQPVSANQETIKIQLKKLIHIGEWGAGEVHSW